MKSRIVVVSMLLFLFVAVAQAAEYSSAGFYYPLKDDSPNFSSCGRWLERGNPNGCYPQDPSRPKVYHVGSDMLAAINTSVYAIADGVVKSMSSSGWSNGGSTTNVALLISHKLSDGRGFVALYGHLKQSGTVQVNQRVTAGQKIGEIGDWVGGDHIHFGILSSGLSTSACGGDYLGRWLDSEYGVRSDGYYDNGFVDPIWFITHNAPDNWISKSYVNPDSLTTINTMNPWFVSLCGISYDSRCDGSDATAFTECVYEGSTLCAPSVSSYSAVSGGGFQSNRGAGGDNGSLPDFIIKNIWLSDSSGNNKTVFTPGEAMQIHVEVKNVGVDTPSGIDVEYFRSNGYYKDSDPTNVGTDFIHKDDLEGGETHNELKNTTAPMTPGRYNMTAHADSGHDISEEHEGNNWSDEAVFTVSQPSAPKRVRHWLKVFSAIGN
jgi:hypothetical protein